MMRGIRYAVLCGLVFSALGSMSVFAGEYTLTEESYSSGSESVENTVPALDGWLSSIPDDQLDFDQYQQIMEIMNPELSADYEDVDETATPSSATRSNASRGVTVNNIVAPASVYPSPDDGTISTSYLQYFKDMLVKLPYNTKYVFFRVNDYEYRMVYGTAISLSGDVFSGDDLNYIRYYRTNNYGTWLLDSGYEGSFKLTTNGYLVYSNVGDLYPSMNGGEYTYAVYACLFVLVLNLLFNLVRSLFFLGKYRF